MRNKLSCSWLKLSIVTLSFLLVSSAPLAYAVNIIPGCSHGTLASTDVCKDYSAQNTPGSQNPVIADIGIAISILSYVVGISSVIIIIVSALRIVLSNGDANTVSKARGAIIYAAIGIIVTAIAQILVVYVLDKIQ